MVRKYIFAVPRPRKEDRYQFKAWIFSESLPKLQATAEGFGFRHGGKGSLGKMLDAIASGELQIIRVES